MDKKIQVARLAFLLEQTVGQELPDEVVAYLEATPGLPKDLLDNKGGMVEYAFKEAIDTILFNWGDVSAEITAVKFFQDATLFCTMLDPHADHYDWDADIHPLQDVDWSYEGLKNAIHAQMQEILQELGCPVNWLDGLI